uniref:ATP-dependent RNA helicase n=1 Tax=Angiostrongylus cantonensis TaxID=6313 RepID=A0A0K0D2D4_ANGCA
MYTCFRNVEIPYKYAEEKYLDGGPVLKEWCESQHIFNYILARPSMAVVSESRTRNRGNTEYGCEFGGFHNNENAPLRDKRGGFYSEGSFGSATRRDRVDRERYPAHDDSFEFKEKPRGFVPTMENKNFARDGYESARSAIGSREFGYRKVGASSATNTSGGFSRPGFGVSGNLRHDRRDTYDENKAFDWDRGGKDRTSYGGQRVDYSRTRRQYSPMEREGFKRSSSPECFRKEFLLRLNNTLSGDTFGNDSRREDSRFGQRQRYEQEYFNDWDSSGENTFGGRSEFGRNFNSQRNVMRFGAPAWNETSEKKRAPKDWEPEETTIGTLFERDFSNSEYLDKEQDDSVTVDGVQNYTLISSWESSGLNPKLVKTCIEKCNYKHVRPIQAATIPLVLDGYDVMAHAETGGGKTAAFVLPILHQILASGDRKSRRCGSILALVVAPTRELAKQLYDMFRKHAFGSFIMSSLYTTFLTFMFGNFLG